MPAPTDRNARIALATGWTWHEEDFFLAPDFGSVPELRTHWLAPIAKGERYAVPGTPPDYVGTLEGVSEMLRGLNDWERSIGSIKRWYITHVPNGFTCQRRIGVEVWESYTSKEPGDCVGDAYLSVFGKEDADAS